MCTAITFQTNSHYFGRNLDLEYSYDEAVTITPRGFPLAFRRTGTLKEHFALIGMAYIADGYPLYYDATNEKGLSMAGLHFPGNAVWFPEQADMDNIAPFELIPWILSQCESLAAAKVLLRRLNLLNVPFSEQLPLTPLHWLIADRTGSAVIESTADGLHVHENPVGVLTNNPPFLQQLFSLNNYMQLSPDAPENRFLPTQPLLPYSRGMGALGLPGDWSSQSRFIRAVFVKANARCADDEHASVNQFFHLLASVSMPKGCVRMPDGSYEYTRYTSCCNTDEGIYYYRTYENSTPIAVKLKPEGKTLTAYPTT